MTRRTWVVRFEVFTGRDFGGTLMRYETLPFVPRPGLYRYEFEETSGLIYETINAYWSAPSEQWLVLVEPDEPEPWETVEEAQADGWIFVPRAD